MQKLVIADTNSGYKGKSTAIRGVFNLLLDLGAEPVPGTLEGSADSDIRRIVIYKGVKIGIESQGDPNSRILTSIPYFVEEKCDIIVCACRSYGDTHNCVYNLSEEEYEVVWSPNPWVDNHNSTSITILNRFYAQMVVAMKDLRISKTI